jgi:hypothetical protein
MSKKMAKISAGLMLLTLLIGSTGAWFYSRQNAGPIPKSIVTSVAFPLYYPVALPDGYKLQKSSVKNVDGLVFYTFSMGANNIYISEQALPAVPPDLGKLVELLEFKKVDVKTGSAVIGLNTGTPAAIFTTNTTLVSINATKNVPSDLVSDLVKSLVLYK